ncbi:MAG: SRPBCC family protein [Bacteroidales bacterium]
MLKIESKTGKLPVSDEKAYNFLSDFNNFTAFVPADKIKDWKATDSSCSFNVDVVGEVGIKTIEKEPYKLIKLSGDEKSKFAFFLWIQLKNIEPQDTMIKLTIHADINPMLQMLAKNPLQKVVDLLVDQIIGYFEKQKG